MSALIIILSVLVISAFLIWLTGRSREVGFRRAILELFDGPQGIPDESGPPKCIILHENAKAEWELYGEIVSWSIREHMKTCPVRIANLEPKKPGPPQALRPLHPCDLNSSVVSAMPKMRTSSPNPWRIKKVGG